MFWAAFRSPSATPNGIFSLWFIYPCGDRPLSMLGGKWVPTQHGQRPVITWVYATGCKYSLMLLMTSGMPLETCWALINFGIINSIIRLHLVGYFYWFVLRFSNPWILCKFMSSLQSLFNCEICSFHSGVYCIKQSTGLLAAEDENITKIRTKDSQLYPRILAFHIFVFFWKIWETSNYELVQSASDLTLKLSTL
jgi:hypothetical protein